jgi:hypothetical protein
MVVYRQEFNYVTVHTTTDFKSGFTFKRPWTSNDHDSQSLHTTGLKIAAASHVNSYSVFEPHNLPSLTLAFTEMNGVI